VSLSRTELRLLSGLLESNGEPVAGATLIERAWPGDGAPGGDPKNLLAVYVWSLRKRLSAIGLGSALKTVRGTGYRMAL
jgi:DNA-binding response OmpR family regulator